MRSVVFIILVLVVTAFSAISGFRRGITRQPATLLGLAFGAVAARVLTPALVSNFEWTHSVSPAPEFNAYTASVICASSIYTAVYWLFFILSPILNMAFKVIRVGILNRIAGGFFSLVKNLLWLSIFFNILVLFQPGDGLLRFLRANDGNPVAAVMEMTPAILGCYGGEDFAHFYQLKEAKTIS